MPDYPCLVAEVHDGDTIRVTLAGFGMQRSFWVRVPDWDAAESWEPGGEETTRIARNLLPVGTLVHVRCSVEPDRSFDRYVAEIILPSGDNYVDVIRRYLHQQ